MGPCRACSAARPARQAAGAYEALGPDQALWGPMKALWGPMGPCGALQGPVGQHGAAQSSTHRGPKGPRGLWKASEGIGGLQEAYQALWGPMRLHNAYQGLVCMEQGGPSHRALHGPAPYAHAFWRTPYSARPMAHAPGAEDSPRSAAMAPDLRQFAWPTMQRSSPMAAPVGLAERSRAPLWGHQFDAHALATAAHRRPHSAA